MSALRTWSHTFPVRSLTNGAAIASTDLRSPEWIIQVQTKAEQAAGARLNSRLSRLLMITSRSSVSGVPPHRYDKRKQLC